PVPAPAAVPEPRVQLVPLSAGNREALETLAKNYAEWIEEPGETPDFNLANIAWNAGARRSHHPHRLAVVAGSEGELAERLRAFVRGEQAPTFAADHAPIGGAPRLVFVYTGMGPQWWGMGRQLMDEEPTFARALEECDRLFQAHAHWSILKE